MIEWWKLWKKIVVLLFRSCMFPNAVGFASENLSRVVPDLSDRRVIDFKGYHDWVGRGKGGVVRHI